MHAQYRHNQYRSHYIVHISNNIPFFGNFFYTQLVESADNEPVMQRANYTYLIFFIYSPVSGHLDYFHSVADVKSAAVITGELIFLWNYNFKTTVRCHITHASMAIMKNNNTKMWMWRNWKCFTLLVGMQSCTDTIKKNMGVSQRIKNSTTIWLSNLTSWSLLIMYFLI